MKPKRTSTGLTVCKVYCWFMESFTVNDIISAVIPHVINLKYLTSKLTSINPAELFVTETITVRRNRDSD